MKLLMQPLSSINVRTEALLLTKVEVWWYLVVQLGPNLFPNFDQVRHDYFSLNHRKISLNCPSQYVAVRTRCRCLFREKHCWVSEQFVSLQVSVPLLQCTIGSDSSSVPGTPSRAVSQNGAVAPATPKTGMFIHPPPSTQACQCPTVCDALDQLTQKLKLQQSEKVHGVCNL